jgi:hypothetical protein
VLPVPQVPPVTVGLSTIDEPWHTDEGPDIVPETGSGLTETGVVVAELPQALFTV